MKTLSKIVMSAILFSLSATAQIKNAKTETVKVSGNCDMCKKTIEKAASEKNVSTADWDKDSQMLTITYDASKTSSGDILKKIAYDGYDNEMFLAPEEAYNKLPGCCQYERTQIKAGNEEAHSHHKMAEAMASVPKENILTALYDSYFQLKDALVKSDGALASVKAIEVTKALKSVSMDKMDNNQHKTWMKLLPELNEDAEHIADTKDIKHQRDHFVTLSAKMYEIVKTFNADSTMFYQKCPMYNDGKGAYWLSRESGIKNPYYGSKMLTCGSTTETIK